MDRKKTRETWNREDDGLTVDWALLMDDHITMIKVDIDRLIGGVNKCPFSYYSRGTRNSRLKLDS
jgi:hypothetical protein